MNLANLGLIRDSKGRLIRPRETMLELLAMNASTAENYGFEARELISQVLASIGDMSPQALAPSLTKSTLKALDHSSTKGPKKSKSSKKKKKTETVRSFRQKMKEEQNLVDIDEDISKMDLKTLRKHFGYKKGTIRKGIFCRNVVWQIWRYTKAGKPPAFVVSGCNVRSFRYYVKTITETHTWSFRTKKTDFHKAFGQALSDLTGAGLVSYRDFNIIDQNRINRWVAPSYGAKNIVVLAEKRSFSEELLHIGKKHGVTVQCTGGNASRTTVETMLLEMADAGHDLTKPFIVFVMVDFDPGGWNIAQEFVTQMLELGLSTVKRFWPYGRKRPRQPWIDIAPVRKLSTEFLQQQRHPLKITRKKLGAEWLTATGGLYGEGGKDWALSSEAFIGHIEEYLIPKLKRFLPEDYNYYRIEAIRSLVRPLTNYAAERLAQP